MKNKKKNGFNYRAQRVQSSSLKNDQVAAQSALSLFPSFFANNSDGIFSSAGSRRRAETDGRK